MPKARTTRNGFGKRQGRAIRNAMRGVAPPRPPAKQPVDPNGFNQNDIDAVIAAQAKRARRQERNLRYAPDVGTANSHATVE